MKIDIDRRAWGGVAEMFSAPSRYIESWRCKNRLIVCRWTRPLWQKRPHAKIFISGWDIDDLVGLIGDSLFNLWRKCRLEHAILKAILTRNLLFGLLNQTYHHDQRSDWPAFFLFERSSLALALECNETSPELHIFRRCRKHFRYPPPSCGSINIYLHILSIQ